MADGDNEVVASNEVAAEGGYRGDS